MVYGDTAAVANGGVDGECAFVVVVGPDVIVGFSEAGAEVAVDFCDVALVVDLLVGYECTIEVPPPFLVVSFVDIKGAEVQQRIPLQPRVVRLFVSLAG